MMDALRRILYPAFVATIIATLWAMGDAQAKADQAYNRRYWPAVDPATYRAVTSGDHAEPLADDEPEALFATSLEDF